MRDRNRVYGFCTLLANLWRQQAADLRFGQLMTVIFDAIRKDGKDPFYMEDDEMEGFINDFLCHCNPVSSQQSGAEIFHDGLSLIGHTEQSTLADIESSGFKPGCYDNRYHRFIFSRRICRQHFLLAVTMPSEKTGDLYKIQGDFTASFRRIAAEHSSNGILWDRATYQIQFESRADLCDWPRFWLPPESRSHCLPEE